MHVEKFEELKHLLQVYGPTTYRAKTIIHNSKREIETRTDLQQELQVTIKRKEKAKKVPKTTPRGECIRWITKGQLASKCARLNLLADGQRHMNGQINSQFEGLIIPCGTESEILHHICKRPRSNASVRHRSPSWSKHGARIERSEKLDWWSVCGGYGRSQNNATIWYARNKIQIKWSGNSQKKQRICIPMQDGRTLARRTAVIYRCCTKRGWRLRAGIPATFISRKRRCHKIFRALWWKYIFRNHVCARTKLHDPKDDFPIPLNHIALQGHENKRWCAFKKRPSVINRNMEGVKSLSEPVIGVTRFALLNKNPQKGYMWFQADWRRNRSQQDQEKWARRMVNCVKRLAINKWAEAKTKTGR